MSPIEAVLAAGRLDASALAVHPEWRPRDSLWRVYGRSFGPVGFNATDRGYARFSPLRRPDGSIVPVLYAATTLTVALMESVFRDVPTPSTGAIVTLPPPDQEERRVAELELRTPLRMIDLGSVGLRKLGLRRADAIDCDSAHYTATQALGAWIYQVTQSAPDPVHGIVWTSRQDDSGQAALFFGDRLAGNELRASSPDLSLHGGHVFPALIQLAERMDVFIDVW